MPRRADYDAVFISGLERDSMPLGSPKGSELASERTLLHLTIMRAREHVYLTYCSDDDRNAMDRDNQLMYHNDRLARWNRHAEKGPSILLNDVLHLLHRV
jgi:superfamily I DNA/RNA helicase